MLIGSDAKIYYTLQVSLKIPVESSDFFIEAKEAGIEAEGKTVEEILEELDTIYLMEEAEEQLEFC
ncbi:hypothetical protein [Chengkuizengella sediminis]|uniref:hypothetical protein n=1 Tax=Chengkuizengella sediminis TaxID=1885917 RepID=UPI0013897895|nr:hypothetical protein [Chengkuizengella sediminis]NDI33212.1 hypothetical protein [Chengkuizengella sediminis]